MKKRWYRLLGITEEQVAAWAEELREDLNVFRTKDGELVAMIKLDWMELIRMRYLIRRCNKEDHYGFRLRRV